ncbi:hypothetical protein [Arthrobacter sp. C152]
MALPLPGNPHHRDANYAEVEAEAFVVAQASLALAYEQRTANLIALMQPVVMPDGKGVGLTIEKCAEIQQEVLQRVGLAAIPAPAPRPKTVTISAPTLPTKAEGSKEYEYLLRAADKLRHGYEAGGSGVRNMIADILDETAQALIDQE